MTYQSFPQLPQNEQHHVDTVQILHHIWQQVALNHQTNNEIKNQVKEINNYIEGWNRNLDKLQAELENERNTSETLNQQCVQAEDHIRTLQGEKNKAVQRLSSFGKQNLKLQEANTKFQNENAKLQTMNSALSQKNRELEEQKEGLVKSERDLSEQFAKASNEIANLRKIIEISNEDSRPRKRTRRSTKF